jgi:hypothetical protein
VTLFLLGPPFLPIILFLFTTFLTGMTGISLHVQRPLTSQSHNSFLKQNNCCFLLLQIKIHPLNRIRSLLSAIFRIFIRTLDNFISYFFSPLFQTNLQNNLSVEKSDLFICTDLRTDLNLLFFLHHIGFTI